MNTTLLTLAAVVASGQLLLADSAPITKNYLMGSTLLQSADKGVQPAASSANARGPLVTPDAPFEEETAIEVVVSKALEASQSVQVYNNQVGDVFEAVKNGETLLLEDYRTSFVSALNAFFFGR